MNTVQIPINELCGGMEIIAVPNADASFKFAYYGQPLPQDCSQIREQLAQHGVKYVFVHALEHADIAKAESLHNDAKQVTTKLLNNVRLGERLDIAQVKHVVSDLVEQCIKSPEAFISITRLKDFDNYTYTHSVNVAVIAISLGKRLGASTQELNSIGFAGLMHDIGKMQIPEQILNKPSKFSAGEFAVMKSHAFKGYTYLRSAGIRNEAILQAVRYHHEKADGTGYPDGLRDADIPKFAKILSVADVYDAITSDRVYHKGMQPAEAIKLLYSWSGKHFNDTILRAFISIMTPMLPLERG